MNGMVILLVVLVIVSLALMVLGRIQMKGLKRYIKEQEALLKKMQEDHRPATDWRDVKKKHDAARDLLNKYCEVDKKYTMADVDKLVGAMIEYKTGQTKQQQEQELGIFLHTPQHTKERAAEIMNETQKNWQKHNKKVKDQHKNKPQ